MAVSIKSDLGNENHSNVWTICVKNCYFRNNKPEWCVKKLTVSVHQQIHTSIRCNSNMLSWLIAVTITVCAIIFFSVSNVTGFLPLSTSNHYYKNDIPRQSLLFYNKNGKKFKNMEHHNNKIRRMAKDSQQSDNDVDDDDIDEDDDVALSSPRTTEYETTTTTSVVTASNVLGTELQCCCNNVRNTGIGTGFYRNGYCTTGEQDIGKHTVCVQVTDEFLQYSKLVGNDLSTPVPHYLFPGLKHNDIWCLCVERWVQAYKDGMAPKLYLRASHERALSYVPYEILRSYAIDQIEADNTVQELNDVRDRLNKLL